MAKVQRSRLTVKGQVTIPQQTRKRLGLQPGDEIEFSEEDGRVVIKKTLKPSPFARYRGFLRHLAGRTSDEVVEEMRGPWSQP